MKCLVFKKKDEHDKQDWQDAYDRQDSQTNKMGQNIPVLWPLFDHVSECYLMCITVSSLSCGCSENWPELWLIHQQIQIKMRKYASKIIFKLMLKKEGMYHIY